MLEKRAWSPGFESACIDAVSTGAWAWATETKQSTDAALLCMLCCSSAQGLVHQLRRKTC